LKLSFAGKHEAADMVVLLNFGNFGSYGNFGNLALSFRSSNSDYLV